MISSIIIQNISIFHISQFLLLYSPILFTSFFYIYIFYISIKYSFQKTKFTFKILSLEKIKIFISIYPFEKSIFPVPGEKIVAKVKPRNNIRWYFELVRHQYHLISQAQDLERIYHSQIQKSVWSSLLYRAPILGEKKNPCSTLSPWNIPSPFLEFHLFIYREQTVNTNENSIHKVLLV